MDDFGKDLLHTPEGVWDHYGADCEDYLYTAALIRRKMRSYGFDDIRTPSFEFFDVFSGEIGTRPSRELYKFFDKEGNTLTLRPDFTPGVARCAAKYFMDEQEPMRFCYEGSVFSNTSELQGKLKESTQMGAELVCDGSAFADAEMIALLVDSLLTAGLSDFQITVGNVDYFKGLCREAGLEGKQELMLREYISGKNYFAAEELLKDLQVEEKFREQFLRISDFMKNDEEIEEARAQAGNEISANALERLALLYRLLKAYGFEKYISFDLSLLSKYRYYTGVIFRGYTYGVGEPIASGGRYDGLLSHFGKDAPAVGFMIPLDTLVEALRSQHRLSRPKEEIITLSYDDGTFEEVLAEAAKRRSAGERVRLTRK